MWLPGNADAGVDSGGGGGGGGDEWGFVESGQRKSNFDFLDVKDVMLSSCLVFTDARWWDGEVADLVVVGENRFTEPDA